MNIDDKERGGQPDDHDVLLVVLCVLVCPVDVGRVVQHCLVLCLLVSPLLLTPALFPNHIGQCPCVYLIFQ